MLERQQVYVLWCMKEERVKRLRNQKLGKLPGGMKGFEAGPGCGFRVGPSYIPSAWSDCVV